MQVCIQAGYRGFPGARDYPERGAPRILVRKRRFEGQGRVPGEALQFKFVEAQDRHDINLERLLELFLVGALVGAVHLAAPRGQL